jgi:hypothetical protein
MRRDIAELRTVHSIHFVFCFVLNQHRSRPNKTYAGQKKSQILSSWTKPPFEAPPESPFPQSAVRKEKKKKQKKSIHPIVPQPSRAAP